MVSPEIETQILRLHHAEKWPPGTIADQLGVHHSVVERVLAQAGIPKSARCRASKVDPFVPFIIDTFKKYPRLTCSRLFYMVKERGYKGCESHFRDVVRRYRPPRTAEAYLRLKTYLQRLAFRTATVNHGALGLTG